MPIPVTDYGASKLAAEKIHQIWQAKVVNNRRLVIVKPSVVFGTGGGDNVSCLIKEVSHRYFFCIGNEFTHKAGVYVKELCNAMWWVLRKQKRNGAVSLFNMSMNPGPSIGNHVKAVCKTQGIICFVSAMPYMVLRAIAYVIDALVDLFESAPPIQPSSNSQTCEL